jgi:DNA-binding SARP family transcriptional activator/tetratricopeptide (TPR) repeat protein
VEFRILGPLEARAGPERLELGGARQQVVLAVLLLNANHVVSVGRLLEAVYGEELPPTARSQTQITISALRRLLAAHGQDGIISTRGQGYAIEVGDGQLDSLRFDALVAQARAADDPAGAVARYRDALRLWRGPALADLDSELLRAAAARLDEQRIAVNEDRLALELGLGRHHELTGELTELTAEHPLREQLPELLMLALYRCGRSAEALQVYRQVRRRLRDELGLEPGERLRELERAILAADPALDLPAPAGAPAAIQPGRSPAPGLLPADIADFTGRADQIRQIGGQLSGAPAAEPRLAVPIVVITGPGGVGKTTLAVHAAHGLAGQFPAGQLFADLHAGTGRPVGPGQVLDRFLRALGVPGPQVPDGLDERAEMYRNLLTGRKMLVVLDDAAGESQVTPLLPGSATTGVIITSRRRLAGLAGSVHVETRVFDAGTAVDLLARIAGQDRVQARPEAAAVAGQCGQLPLALRIAGARLAARPHWDLGQLAERLADETRRLDELSHGDMHIRASFSLTYENTSEQGRRLFRRLALLEAPAFSGWLGAALLEAPLTQAEDLFDELVSAHLVEATGEPSQYRFHDLIRVFARERLAAEEPLAEQQAALQRALGALLYLARAAHRALDFTRYPWPDDGLAWPLPAPAAERVAGDPAAWFERERATLVAGVRQAARAGLSGLSWRLMINAEEFFETRAYFDDWRETVELALAAARDAGDLLGQAMMSHTRGVLSLEQYRLGPAQADLTAAVALFGAAGEPWGVAHSIRDLGFVAWLSGRLDDAARSSEQALAIFRRIGDQLAAARVLRFLVGIQLDRGLPDQARQRLAELRAARGEPDRRHRNEAQTLYMSGRVHLLTGELAEAAEDFGRALALVRDMGDRVGEAHLQHFMGMAKLRQGEPEAARSMLRRALELAGEVGERLAEGRSLLGLAELALADGDHGEAIAFGERAAGVFGGMGAPLYQAQALDLVRAARALSGDEGAPIAG